jgi:hypothetical protein
MSIDVFISHSSRDRDIARALIELLRSAGNIPPERIRCTSVDGFRLEVGASVNDQLRMEVNEARVFIGLITPNSIQSPYVLFEVGARWGAGLKLAPVLAGGAGHDLLKGPLSVLHALDCSVADEMHQLVSDITNLLNYPRSNPELYEHYVRKLVSVSKRKKPKNPM